MEKRRSENSTFDDESSFRQNSEPSFVLHVKHIAILVPSDGDGGGDTFDPTVQFSVRVFR
jgi:hypothetical protein